MQAQCICAKEEMIITNYTLFIPFCLCKNMAVGKDCIRSSYTQLWGNLHEKRDGSKSESRKEMKPVYPNPYYLEKSMEERKLAVERDARKGLSRRKVKKPAEPASRYS